MHALCSHWPDGALRGLTGFWHYKHWFLDWWGAGKCPSYYNCGFYMVGEAAKLWGPWVHSWERQCSRTSRESSPISPMQRATLQHPHYPHSSKSSPERSITSHKRLYRLACRSISRGPLYLCLLVSNEEAEHRESADSQLLGFLHLLIRILIRHVREGSTVWGQAGALSSRPLL